MAALASLFYKAPETTQWKTGAKFITALKIATTVRQFLTAGDSVTDGSSSVWFVWQSSNNH
jgi:hypothetical protein